MRIFKRIEKLEQAKKLQKNQITAEYIINGYCKNLKKKGKIFSNNIEKSEKILIGNAGD